MLDASQSGHPAGSGPFRPNNGCMTAYLLLLRLSAAVRADVLPNTASGVIVKSGVSASELGSDLINCFHLDSIFEFNPGNHLCQVAKAA